MNELSPTAEAFALTDTDDLGSENPHPYCPAVRVVANWHNGNHDGAFSNCDQQPCDGVKRVSD